MSKVKDSEVKNLSIQKNAFVTDLKVVSQRINKPKPSP